MTIPDAGKLGTRVARASCPATAADIVAMFDRVRTPAGFVNVRALLSSIPPSALTDADRGEITRAMVRAVARIWSSRSGEP
jgi:hypothetical protein